MRVKNDKMSAKDTVHSFTKKEGDTRAIGKIIKCTEKELFITRITK